MEEIIQTSKKKSIGISLVAGINILTIVVGALVFYFTGNKATAKGISDNSTTIAITNVKVDDNTKNIKSILDFLQAMKDKDDTAKSNNSIKVAILKHDLSELKETVGEIREDQKINNRRQNIFQQRIAAKLGIVMDDEK